MIKRIRPIVRASIPRVPRNKTSEIEDWLACRKYIGYESIKLVRWVKIIIFWWSFQRLLRLNKNSQGEKNIPDKDRDISYYPIFP
jgi:hypothetical protein